MVLNKETPTMATINVRKQPRTAVPPPPRTINVQNFAESRASELESLHSIISDRSNNNFRSNRNKRRRTSGYDNRVANNKGRKRRKFAVVGDKKDKILIDGIDQNKKVPRRVRRRVELKKNPETGFCASGDGTKRLRTHVWHAKRFEMIKLWGFYLPLGLHGRGKGSRAILKRSKNGAIVHDASYYSAVQLEGREDSLLSVLKMVLTPSPDVLSKDLFHSVLSGAVYGKSLLHHAGPQVPQTISPVNYMWRPNHSPKTLFGADDGSTNGLNIGKSNECPTLRQLWVWIHASAFMEGYDALKFACVKQMNETGLSINCSSLEGKLAKLEVMGLKSFQLIQKILNSETCSSDNSWKLNQCSIVKSDSENHIGEPCVLESEESIASHMIISHMVYDPRTLPKSRISKSSEATKSNTGYNISEVESMKNDTLEEIPNKETDKVTSLSLERKSATSALWDINNGICPPIEEISLCMEKHQLRLTSFCLGPTTSGTLNNSIMENSSRSCPVMLLKDTDQMGSLKRWSIILPINWAKAFWIPLVSNGAHAVGLREKHWIASDAGLPFFPSDFADSHAYSQFKETEAISSDLKDEKRPFIKRPLRVPIPPPWTCIRLAFDEGSTTVRDFHPSEDICSEDAVSSGHRVLPFEGFVARTSNMLAGFLNEICGDHLLLYYSGPDKKTRFATFMKDETKIKQDQNGSRQLNEVRKLFFLRVLLHAYREGSFEEGAVVCAPQPNDITSWTSRSNLHAIGISMYQKTPFKRISSMANWVCASGFVRGSKKPTAGALCEGSLLARLREERWKEIPAKRRKKEIYVLVRNLRSTAYRLARATIVLEQQAEDVEFM